ncbi:MAG: hypothetical protein AB1416_06405 [Actinomycetota bacterium]
MPARRSASLVAALVAAVAMLVAAAPALGITRAQADRVAAGVVAGERGPLVLFRHPAPLPVGTLVAEGGPGPRARGTTVRRTGLSVVASTDVAQGRLIGRRWLYWADLAPHARFQHPSLLILVDDATGRVITRLPMTWWPLVNGKRPRFLDGPAAYEAARDRVLSRGDRLPGGARGKERAAGVTLTPLRVATGITGPPDLSRDCIVTVGDRVEFANDFAAIDQIAKMLKLRKRDAADAAGLDAAIGELKKGTPGCRDVVIWVSGHGFPATGSSFPHPKGGTIPESRNAQVALKFHTAMANGRLRVDTEMLDSEVVRRIMGKHTDVTFKLVVDACFAGRWTELKDVANLRVVLAAARADQMAFGYMAPGRYQVASQRNAVITNGKGTVTNTTSNPKQASTFTSSLALGLASWASSEADRARTGDDLAKGLVAAHTDSRRNNFAVIQGITETVVGDYTHRPEVTPPPPPPPAAPVAYTGSCGLSLFDPSEVDFGCSFSQPTDGFGIGVPGRTVTAFLEPPGATCTIGSIDGTPNGFLSCSFGSPVAAGQARSGRVRLFPPPAAGMECDVYGRRGSEAFQRIGTCTGP